MASKQDIASDIRRTYGNALNIQQLTEALGFKDRRAARGFMAGVPVINMGKEKKYLAMDVAKRIYDRQEDHT